MWRGMLVWIAACGRTGFASLPCTDSHVDDVALDTAMTAASHSTLTLDKLDPGMELDDFPLLVTLDDSRAARDLLDVNATDIRFLDANNNVLPHEIDQAGAANGEATLVWVKVPAIIGTTTTLQVLVGGALPARSTAPVWGPEYEAVYHLNDAADATGHGHDGTATGGATFVPTPACAIASCADLDGITGVITIADTPTLDLPMPTISGWIYQRSATTGVMTLVSREASGPNQDFMLASNNGGAFAELVVTGGIDHQLTGPAITLGHWTHLALTYGGTLTLYVDGVNQGMTTIGPDAQHTATEIWVGAVSGLAGGQLDGMADEIRLERVFRTDKWIKYEDAAMRDQVISYGPIER